MRGFPFLAIAAILVGALPVVGSAQVKQLGPNPTADDFIHGLLPPAGAPAVKYRGLRVLNANPTDAAAAETGPSVNVDIKFALNSADLSDAAKDTVKQMAAAMNSHDLSTYHFLIEGHTDTTGTAAYNQTLSKKRADAVRAFLIENYHVDASRLESIGRGQTMLADPAHPESPVNRRVQVVNLGS